VYLYNIVFVYLFILTCFPSAYAQQLEDMIAEKQEQLAMLRDKTRAFRSLPFSLASYTASYHIIWPLGARRHLTSVLCRECLADEEVQSNKMNQNRRH
jgi:hypothetical protein